MAEQLSGGAKCIKYTLFIFNLLFLLCGLALIIVGAIVQVQTGKNGFSGSTSSAGIFLIVIGSIIFIVAFFGCAGAIYNNYCMVVTFGVLLLLILLAEIAGAITGFVLKNQLRDAILDQMNRNQMEYDGLNQTQSNPNLGNLAWDGTQRDLQCCGTTDYMSWENNTMLAATQSVPDSCCKTYSPGCGRGMTAKTDPQDSIYTQGCYQKLLDGLNQYLVIVGIVAATVALIQLIGIIFAFCLAAQLRRDYRVV